VEALLARLVGEESQGRARLAALKGELSSFDSAETRIRVRLPASRPATTPTTPGDKVRLFRELFVGRQDVFPTRFVSKKTGKPGYAPACKNKFVRGACELPRIKCGECPNQAFVRVDDAAILAHLRGRHVMGVYPLLDDETCWFLAVDFDKKSWAEDVAAFVAACRDVGLPASVERSRSGEGAHVWFFFSEPVAAPTARKMGCYRHKDAGVKEGLEEHEGTDLHPLATPTFIAATYDAARGQAVQNATVVLFKLLPRPLRHDPRGCLSSRHQPRPRLRDPGPGHPRCGALRKGYPLRVPPRSIPDCLEPAGDSEQTGIIRK